MAHFAHSFGQRSTGHASVLAPRTCRTWVSGICLCVGFAATVWGQGPLAAFQRELADAIAKAEPSVVAIARVRHGSAVAPTSPTFIPNEYATGVIVGPGKVLTNYHVLGNPEQNDYWVWSKGTPFQVVKVESPKAADPWLDLAVLEVDQLQGASIAMGDAGRLKKGHVVIALGNPYAIARDGNVSAALGIVSNLGRKAPPIPGQDARETLHQLGTLIQIDARLPRGASGGALINAEGELVGLTMALAALAEEESDAGFAIPVNAAFKSAVKKLTMGQVDQYGYLGVLPAALPVDERREGRTGVVIQNVVPGTPASLAGLRRLDIIAEVDGRAVTDPDHLVRLVSSQVAGAELKLGILRGENASRKIQRTVTLSKKRIGGLAPVISEASAVTWRGGVFEYMTAMPDYPFHSYKVDAQGCVGMLQVDKDSPLWQAGFRSGDYVSHVAGGRVFSPDQFYKAVQKYESQSVKLRRPAVAGKPAEDLEVSAGT